MPKERVTNAAFTLSKQLLKKAIARSVEVYGKRSFSEYVRDLITADLAKK